MKIKASWILVILVLLVTNIVKAQDTIRIMQYNLLYYGKDVFECDQDNNNVDDKNGYLQTIINYAKPDIFSVNELDGEGIAPNVDDAGYLLDNALNVNGINYYRRTEFPEIFLANTLFYNSNKLTLKKHDVISMDVGAFTKIFNAYKFYHNSADLAETNDTVFFTCIVAHLKAGDGTAERQERADEVAEFMKYMENLGEAGNYFFMGDFNLYNDDEDAFQELINPTNATYKFYDPVNQIGNWHTNSAYKDYHTQSTHSTYNGCASTGGMDDRFDFILASGNVMNGVDKMQYISNSYTTLGQDGSSYNTALNTTSNSSVPTAVAQALYNNSDHLPVLLDIKIDKDLGDIAEITDVYHNPENPYSNQDVTVTAEIIDNNNVFDEIILKWGNTTANYTDTIVMTATGSKYTAVFSGLPSGTNIFYKVEALNAQGDVIDSSDEKSFSVTDFGFSNISYNPEFPDSSNVVTVSCEFTDPQELMYSLKVMWGKHANELYTGELMSKSGNIYEAEIREQNTADTVYFNIIAKDIKSDTIAISDLFYYVVGKNTGINIYNNSGEMIFSNPVNDVLVLALKSFNRGEYNLEIVSLSGQKKYSENIYINTKTFRKNIDVSFLDKGLFLLNIYKEPSFKISRKFIKE